VEGKMVLPIGHAAGTRRESEGRARPDDSTRTVLVARGAGLGVALAKLGAAVFTGSAALAAEAAHSLADSGNDLSLFVAQRRSGRPADDQHPLGYGREAYFWALIATIGVFVTAAVFSLREGIEELMHPSATSSFAVAYLVLAISAVLDLVSIRQSAGQLIRRPAGTTGSSWPSPGLRPTPRCGPCSPRTRCRSPGT
jgi:cation diffusion facilitator family transporter